MSIKSKSTYNVVSMKILVNGSSLYCVQKEAELEHRFLHFYYLCHVF